MHQSAVQNKNPTQHPRRTISVVLQGRSIFKGERVATLVPPPRGFGSARVTSLRTTSPFLDTRFDLVPVSTPLYAFPSMMHSGKSDDFDDADSSCACASAPQYISASILA